MPLGLLKSTKGPPESNAFILAKSAKILFSNYQYIYFITLKPEYVELNIQETVLLDVLSIYPHCGALQLLAVLGMFHIHLVSLPLLLHLVVEALHGLLAVVAQAVLLALHLKKLHCVGL